MKRISVLLMVFFAAFMASGASVKISDMTPTNFPSSQSLLEISAKTGAGYSTRSITMSNLVRTALSNLPIAFNLQTNAVNVGTANYLNLLPGAGISFLGTNTTTTNSVKVVAEVTTALLGTASNAVFTLLISSNYISALSLVDYKKNISATPFTNTGPVTLAGGLTNTGATLLNGSLSVTNQITVGRDPTAALELVTLQLLNVASNALSTAGGAVGFTNASILYVQTNGYALGTAIRGNPDRPYNTLTAAVSQAQSGDTIRVGAGTHYVLSTRLTIPNNVSMVGEGMHATKIVGNARLQQAGHGAMVTPGNNSYIGQMSILNTNEAAFAAPFGVYHGISAQTFTNVFVQGVELSGASDTLYCYSSNITSITLDSCILRSTWDNIFSFGHTNSMIQLMGCLIISSNTGLPISSTQVRNVHVGFGRLQIDNCRLEAWGGTDFAANLHVGDHARVWINNSSLNGGLAASYFKITNSSDGGGVWIQSSSVGFGDYVGAGTTTWDSGSYKPTYPINAWTNIPGTVIDWRWAGHTNNSLAANVTYTFANTNDNVTPRGVLVFVKTDGSTRGVQFDAPIYWPHGAPETNFTGFRGYRFWKWQGTNYGDWFPSESGNIITNAIAASGSVSNIALTVMPVVGQTNFSVRIEDTNGVPAVTVSGDGRTLSARTVNVKSNIFWDLHTAQVDGTGTNFVADFAHQKIVLLSSQLTNIINVQVSTNRRASAVQELEMIFFSGPTNRLLVTPSSWWQATNRVTINSNSFYALELRSVGANETDVIVLNTLGGTNSAASSPPADPLIGDVINTNVWGVYAMRKIKAAQSGPVIFVMESQGSTITGIQLDGNGDLDTNSIKSFAAGAGATNVYVISWVDLSGNSRHLSNNASQARILYNSTIIETISQGFPAINFLDANVLTNLSAFISQPITTYFIGQNNAATDQDVLFGAAGAYVYQGGTAGDLLETGGSANIIYVSPGIGTGFLGIFKFDGSTSSLTLNNGAGNAANVGTGGMAGMNLGNIAPAGSTPSNIKAAEFWIFTWPDADGGTKQEALRDNFDARFNIW